MALPDGKSQSGSAAEQIAAATTKKFVPMNAPKGYRWSPKWEQNDFSSGRSASYQQTPYIPDSEAGMAMPNYDKLRPWEQKVMGALPGIVKKFSDTALGQFVGRSIMNAEKDFNETFLGKILYAIDLPFEGLERTSGLIAQHIYLQEHGIDWDTGATTQAERHELTKDMFAAGSFLTDFVNLPEWEFVNGQRAGLVMDKDLPGLAGVVEARKMITALRQSGMSRKEAIETVREQIYEEHGALSFRMQMQDLGARVFFDPLNWVLPAIKPVRRIQAAAARTLTSKIPREGLEVLLKSSREGGKFTKRYWTFKKAIESAEESGRIMGTWDKLAVYLTGGLEHHITLLDEIGEVTPQLLDIYRASEGAWWSGNALNRIANSKIPLARGIAKQLTLTPESLAHEMLSVFRRQFDNHVAGIRTAEGLEQYVRAIVNDAFSPKYGHGIMSIEGQVLSAALKKTMDDVIAPSINAYKQIRTEAEFMQELAQLFGDPKITPVKLLDDLMTDGVEATVKRLRKAGMNDAQEVALRNSMETFEMIHDSWSAKKWTDFLPLSVDQLKGTVKIGIMSVVESTATEAFGVQTQGLIRKMANAMKAGETLAFLRMNPGYPVRNHINNTFTLLGRQLNPWIRQSKIDDLVKKLGDLPYRMGEGVGMSGETLGKGAVGGRYFPGQKIIQKLKGKDTPLDEIRRTINDLNIKFDMGEVSRRLERRASERAFYSGYLQGMNMFWEPDIGFTSIRKGLPAEVLAKMTDQQIETLENVIRGYGNTHTLDLTSLDDIDEAGAIFHAVKSEVEATTGFKFEDVFDNDFIDTLQDGLHEAFQKSRADDNPNVLTSFFNDMRTTNQQNLSDLTAARSEMRKAYAKHLVDGERYAAIPTMVADTIDDWIYMQVGHQARMLGVNPLGIPQAQRRAFWSKILAEEAEAWKRHFARVKDDVMGLMTGLAENPRLKVNTKMLDDMLSEYSTVWDDFFKFRDKKYAELFDALDNKKPTTLTFEAIQDALVPKYDEIAKEEIKILEKIDDELVAILSRKDKKMADTFAGWRSAARKDRLSMRKKTQKFIADVRELENPADIHKAWKKFQMDSIHNMQKINNTQRRGLVALYGDMQSGKALQQMSEFNAATARAVANKFKFPLARETTTAKKAMVRINNGVQSTAEASSAVAQWSDLAKTVDDILQNPEDLANAVLMMPDGRILSHEEGIIALIEDRADAFSDFSEYGWMFHENVEAMESGLGLDKIAWSVEGDITTEQAEALIKLSDETGLPLDISHATQSGVDGLTSADELRNIAKPSVETEATYRVVTGSVPTEERLVNALNRYLVKGYDDIGPVAAKHLEDLGIDIRTLDAEIEAEQLLQQRGNMFEVSEGKLPDDLTELSVADKFEDAQGNMVSPKDFMMDAKLELTLIGNRQANTRLEDLLTDPALQDRFMLSIYEQIDQLAKDEDTLRAAFKFMQEFEANYPQHAELGNRIFWALVEDRPGEAIHFGIQPGGRTRIEDLIDNTVRNQIATFKSLEDMADPELVAEAILYRNLYHGNDIPEGVLSEVSTLDWRNVAHDARPKFLKTVDNLTQAELKGRQVLYFAVDEGDEFLIDLIWKGGSVDIQDAEGTVFITGELAEHLSDIPSGGVHPPKNIVKVEHYTGHTRYARKRYPNDIDVPDIMKRISANRGPTFVAEDDVVRYIDSLGMGNVLVEMRIDQSFPGVAGERTYRAALLQPEEIAQSTSGRSTESIIDAMINEADWELGGRTGATLYIEKKWMQDADGNLASKWAQSNWRTSIDDRYYVKKGMVLVNEREGEEIRNGFVEYLIQQDGYKKAPMDRVWWGPEDNPELVRLSLLPKVYRSLDIDNPETIIEVIWEIPNRSDRSKYFLRGAGSIFNHMDAYGVTAYGYAQAMDTAGIPTDKLAKMYHKFADRLGGTKLFDKPGEFIIHPSLIDPRDNVIQLTPENVTGYFPVIDVNGTPMSSAQVMQQAMVDLVNGAAWDDAVKNLPDDMRIKWESSLNEWLIKQFPDQVERSVNMDALFPVGDPDIPMRPDVRRLLNDGGPPVDEIKDAAYSMNGGMMLDGMESRALQKFDSPKVEFGNLNQADNVKVNQYLDGVRGEFKDASAASRKFAEMRRDFALLNYRRRHGYDNTMDLFAPYAFWMTHSMQKWALSSLDRPAMATTYMRLRKALATMGAPKEGFPSRLNRAIKIPLFDPPDWLGDKYFINPMQLALPFDQMLYPWEQRERRENNDIRRAEEAVRSMVAEGLITQAEASEALDLQSGTVWDRALAIAESSPDRDDDFDLANVFASFHAPLTWGYKALKGETEDIGPLTPMGRNIKKFYGLLGINPVVEKNGFGSMYWTVNSSVREQLGLHPFDKWEDYRIDRALSNLVADGKITSNEALRLMIERDPENEMFVEAAKRAGEQYARGSLRADSLGEKVSSVLAFVANVAGLPVFTYPEGEEHQRQLSADFGRAYAAYEDGDLYALRQFFDRHPEYESRLALWKEPAERLQSFLIDEIWNAWNQMPTLHKQQIADSLGQRFQAGFLDKETRNYAAFAPDELAIFLKVMGGDPPGGLGSDAIGIELAPTEVAIQVQAFYDTRRYLFPNYRELQNAYFEIDEDYRRNFLINNTALLMYWGWRNDFFHNNPGILPYVDDDYELEYKSAEQREAAYLRQPTFSRTEWEWAIGSSYVQMATRIYNGEYVSEDIIDALKAKAEELNMSYDQFLVDIAISK